MNIFGKHLSEYVAFVRWFLVLILVVGLTRLALSLAGVPNSTAKWISVTGVLWLAVLYYSIRVRTSGFGSYKQLLGVIVVLNVVAQAVIITGICIAIFTGTNNIYSASEYAFGGDGKTWLHVVAHLTLGIIFGSLVPWLTGSVIMFASKKLSSRDVVIART